MAVPRLKSRVSAPDCRRASQIARVRNVLPDPGMPMNSTTIAFLRSLERMPDRTLDLQKYILDRLVRVDHCNPSLLGKLEFAYDLAPTNK